MSGNENSLTVAAVINKRRLPLKSATSVATTGLVLVLQTLPRDMMLLQSSRADQVTAWQWLPNPPNSERTPVPSRPSSRLASLSPIQSTPSSSPPRIEVVKAGLESPASVLEPPSKPVRKARPNGAIASLLPNPDLTRSRPPSRLGSEARLCVQRDPLLGIEVGDFTDRESALEASQTSGQNETDAAFSGREESEPDGCANVPRVRVVRHEPSPQASGEGEEADVKEALEADVSGSPEARDVFVVEEPGPAETRVDAPQQPSVSQERSRLGGAPLMELDKVRGNTNVSSSLISQRLLKETKTPVTG